MNEIIRKAIYSLSSVVVLSGCFVLSPVAENSMAANAQGKKKPAKAAGTRVAGPNLNTVEINNYLAKLRDKIDQNWELVDGSNFVTLTMTLGPDAVANDLTTSSSPSNQKAEQAANEAFAKAQPFDPLPASAGEKVKLKITFESFADPHGDSNRNIKTQMDPVASSPKTE